MHNSSATVLIADHDAQDRLALRNRLESEGFVVRETADGRRLLDQIGIALPDLVLLDLQLPAVGGMALCRRIKRHGDVPIVVLTALDDAETRVKMLALYAEDYILKPASPAEVVVRIKRILRRVWLSSLPATTSLRVDEQLSLDFLRREVRTPTGVFRLTPLECRLLQLLVRNSGQVLPTELLLERLWAGSQRSVGSLWEHVRRIRHKIGDDAANPRYLVNVPGLGYCFSGAGERRRRE